MKRMHTPIECKGCGKSFTKHESGRPQSQQYCSDECCRRNNRIVKKQIPKQCKNCKETFTPSRSDKQYCTESCANKYRSRAATDRARAKLPPKKCKFCNKDFTRENRVFRYCNDECHKAQRRLEVKLKARQKVRERHAQLPPKCCNRCGVQIETTIRNRHVAKLCSSCKRVNKLENSRRYDNKPENKKKQAERHQERMQDPDFREKLRLASKQRRIDNPVMFDCVICGTTFHRKRGYKTCSEKCSKQNRVNQYQTREARITSRLSRGIRRSFKGIISEWTWDVLDFTKEDFVKRFESLFTDGMSWENMGEWHIDHIRPKASFKQMDNIVSKDFKECWALENLQPLWESDNCSKGSLWEGKRHKVIQ